MRIVLGILVIVSFLQCAHAGWWESFVGKEKEVSGGLSAERVADGIKEALLVGIKRAVSKVSRKDGFWGNPEIRIPPPASVATFASYVRDLGFKKQVREFERSMNRAAEKAAVEAMPIFISVLGNMTFEDALEIYKRGGHSATQYLRRKAGKRLYAAFKPVISRELDEAKVTALYKGIASKIPFVKLPRLEDYVTQKALDGIFNVLASEEEAIRKNPKARTTSLLKELFGGKR